MDDKEQEGLNPLEIASVIFNVPVENIKPIDFSKPPFDEIMRNHLKEAHEKLSEEILKELDKAINQRYT